MVYFKVSPLPSQPTIQPPSLNHIHNNPLNNQDNINYLINTFISLFQHEQLSLKHHILTSLLFNQLLPTNTITIDLNSFSYIKLKLNKDSFNQHKSNTTAYITILRKNKTIFTHESLEISYDITNNKITTFNKINKKIIYEISMNEIKENTKKILNEIKNNSTRSGVKFAPEKFILPKQIHNRYFKTNNNKITNNSHNITDTSNEITSNDLSIISHNPNSAAAQERGGNRLTLYKDYLTMHANTGDNVDIMLLQETNVINPHHEIYQTNGFNNIFTTFYIPVKRKSDSNGDKRHGQITFVKKAYNAKKCDDYCNNNLLTISFKKNDINYYILNIYITHDKKADDTSAVIDIVNTIISNDPSSNIIIMGDYNTTTNKVATTVLNKINANSHNLFFFNDNNKSTHIKPSTNNKLSQSCIDHTTAIINDPTLRQHYEVLLPIIPTDKNLHHKPIHLKLYSSSFVNNQKSPITKVPSSRPGSSSWPKFPNDTSNTHLLYDKYKYIIEKLNNHQFKRQVLDNSQNIQNNAIWYNLLTSIDKYEHSTTSSRSTTSIKQKQIDLLLYEFIENNFKILEEEFNINKATKTSGNNNNDSKSNKNWCTIRYHTLFKYWCKVNTIYSKEKFNYKNLTHGETKMLTNLLPLILHEEYNIFWSEDEERYINKLVQMHLILCENGNNYEAEQQMKKIVKFHTYHAVRARTQIITQQQVVKHPSSGQLCTDPEAIANAFADQYKTLDTAKAESSSAYYSSQTLITSFSSNMDNYQINNKDNNIIENKKKSEKGLTPKELSGKMNELISYKELSNAIINLKTFTSIGADNIPVVMYKAALRTHKHNDNVINTTKQAIKNATTRKSHFLLVGKNKIVKYKNNYVKRIKPYNDEDKYQEVNPFFLCIHKIMNIIMKTGIIPAVWKLSHIVPLHKGGDAQDTINYRPISLISNGQKIFNKILANRIYHINGIQQNTCSPIFNKNQAGYTPKRERFEQILTILEYANTYNIDENHPVYVLFVDLKRAFDSCTHTKLINIFNKKFNTTNTPVHSYILNMYKNIFFTIKNNNSFSTIVQQLIGIKQGCTLSPLMFNLYFNDVLEAIAPKKGENFITPAYADDLAIGTNNLQVMAKLEHKMNDAFTNLQLDINTKKTVMLVINKYDKEMRKLKHLQHINIIKSTKNDDKKTCLTGNIKSATCELLYNGVKKEYGIVPTFKYLGLEIPHDLSFDFFLNNIQINKHLMINKHTLNNPNVPTNIKIELINKHILPKILHNAPLYGMLMLNDDKSVAFEKAIDAKIAQVINSIQRLPKCKSTSNFTLFDNQNVTPASVTCKTQALRVCLNLINNKDNINSWLRNHLNTLVNPYNITSVNSGEHIQSLKNNNNLFYETDLKNKIIINTPFYSTIWYWLPMFKNCNLTGITRNPIGNNIIGASLLSNIKCDYECIDMHNDVKYITSTYWCDCTPFLNQKVKKWLVKAKVQQFQTKSNVNDKNTQYTMLKNLEEVAIVTNSPLVRKVVMNGIPKEKEIMIMAKCMLLNSKMLNDIRDNKVSTCRYITNDYALTSKSYNYCKKITPLYNLNDGWKLFDVFRGEHMGEHYYASGNNAPLINLCPMCNVANLNHQHLFKCEKNKNLLLLAKRNYLDIITQMDVIPLINHLIHIKSILPKLLSRLKNGILARNGGHGEESEKMREWLEKIISKEAAEDCKMTTKGYTIQTYIKRKKWKGSEAAEEYRLRYVNEMKRENLFYLDVEATVLYENMLLKHEIEYVNVNLISGNDPPVHSANVDPNGHFLCQVLQTLFVATYFKELAQCYPHLVKW